MAAPFLTDRINPKDVVTLLQECRIIDRINNRYMTLFAPKGGRRDKDTAMLESVIAKATERAEALQRTVVVALASFSLLTSAET